MSTKIKTNYTIDEFVAVGYHQVLTAYENAGRKITWYKGGKTAPMATVAFTEFKSKTEGEVLELSVNPLSGKFQMQWVVRDPATGKQVQRRFAAWKHNDDKKGYEGTHEPIYATHCGLVLEGENLILAALPDNGRRNEVSSAGPEINL